MARFYFDWRDNGDLTIDDEGIDFADFQSVKTEAARSLIEHARDIVPGHDRRTLSIEARDDTGGLVLKTILIFEVQLTLKAEAPALR